MRVRFIPFEGSRGTNSDKMGLSTREKGLSAALVVATLLSIGLLVGVIVMGVKLSEDDECSSTTTPAPPTGDICMDSECLFEGARILDSLNQSVDPCQDFFQFTCGGWMDRNPIPSTTSSWGNFNILREELSASLRAILEGDVSAYPPIVGKAKTFYDTCMRMPDKTDFPAYVNTQLADVITDVQNLGLTLGKLRREIVINPLVTLSVNLDEKNTNNHVIYLDTLSFGLARVYLVDENEGNAIRVAYRKLLQDSWTAIDLGGPVDFDAIVKLESDLAKVTLSPEERRDKDLIYNEKNLVELKALTTGNDRLNWDDYLTDIFSEAEPTYNFDTAKFVVRDVAYLHNMTSILMAAQPELIVNYLRWRMLLSQGTHINQELRDIFFEYEKTTTGTQFPAPRWKTCSDLTNSYYGMALANPYVNKHFSNDKIDKMNVMVDLIRTAFGGILQDLDWLDADTKVKALEKAEGMTTFMARPDWILDETLLEAFYSGMGNVDGNDHFGNRNAASKFHSTKQLGEITKPKDKAKWTTDPTVVNAFYYAIYNSISFPAGILQVPFFGMALQALNYGGIGAVIGHEITHGFDDAGRRSDKDGNLIPWWPDEVIAAYQEKALCFIDQYSGYVDPAVNLNLNGNNTLGENIADNGGLREAFMAYKLYVDQNGEEKRLPGLDQYTPEQLFFIAFGQIWCGSYTDAALRQQINTGVHSPVHWRVKGTLDNSEEFAQTWGCPAPTNPCRIW